MQIQYFGDDLINLAFWNEDDYVNATALSQRYLEQTGKKKPPAWWLRLKEAKEYIDYVASQTGIEQDDLVRITQGGNLKDEQGTFLHPDLIIPYASWLSPEFSYRVTKIVQEKFAEEALSDVNPARLRELLKTLRNNIPRIEGQGHEIHSAVHRQIQTCKDSVVIIEEFLKGLSGD